MICEHAAAMEAFGLAVRAELNIAELYTELAGRLGNSFLRQQIQLFADEELEHKRILEEAYKRQFPEIPFALAPHHLPTEISSKDLRDRLPIKEILLRASEEERKMRDFYLDEEEKSTDPVSRRTFRFLAEWEFAHQLEIMAEYELVARYPDYFEPKAHAWKKSA